MSLFFWLLVGHALADYPLQGDFLARAKARKGIPSVAWPIALGAHSIIHAGAVALITGSIALGLAEFAIHCLIDYAKCEGWLVAVWTPARDDRAHRDAFIIDQALHVACKIVWAVLLG